MNNASRNANSVDSSNALIDIAQKIVTANLAKGAKTMF
jgi:hypothetical protein